MIDVKFGNEITSKYQMKSTTLNSDHSQRVIQRDALQLDMARVSSAPIPASKHGLEMICGASCAIGAL
ncbi:hypothetical protein NHG95_28410 [Pseudomonas corrugata]|uniref:hypothetical protein n=1 Tax=Pseudomonas corrugata TaxID=47879 RepID=UPI0028C3EF0B|nr:hypothetical protein [Pseudomonas corrugata]MDU9037058.1 hypothetical protein [Pseudomonas corrugata]